MHLQTEQLSASRQVSAHYTLYVANCSLRAIRRGEIPDSVQAVGNIWLHFSSYVC
jgi:hypothetical protein